ncbi:MAG: discoidin domain-containing protein, partial [Planctomycetota bacterium]
VPHGLGSSLTQDLTVSYTGRIEAKGDTIRVWFLPTANIADPLGDLGVPLVEIQDAAHAGPGSVGIWQESNDNSMIDNVLVMVGDPALAGAPNPEDEATDVPRDVILSWEPGQSANTHDVYFGTAFNDVNDAKRNNPLGVLASQGQSPTTYDPPGLLDFDTIYYWRVDEVNAPPDSTILEGAVWSFTTEPVGYAIENITVTASSAHQADMGPENTINSSGLDDNDLHSMEPTDMWLSGAEPLGAWIEYEFDKVYKLHQMWVWNSNQAVEPILGFGVRDATIEYSTNGTDYTTLGTTHEFARAPGMPGYAYNTTIDFGGAAAKYVRLTATSNWGGIMPQYGLSEVRFFHIPVRAREPNPDSGATDVDLDVTLSFRAGREAAQHDVYLSTDEQAVIDGTAPVNIVLDLDVTHYWRVDEVNEAETPATWQGDLWSFTTHQFLVVDDFESYNDLDTTDPESNRIFLAWLDGYEVPTNGSLVGYDAPPFTEQTIVHGGRQAMPFFYANTGGAAFSEAELTLSPPQDWTAGGAQVLSLWFHGDASNTAAQMYVKVNGTKVAYDGNAGNLALSSWQVWNIDLASVGTGLQSVTKLAIGIDGNGASGKLLFDDIGLYVLAPAPVNEWRIATDDDDVEEEVATGNIDMGSSDLELPYENTGQGNLQIIGVRFTGLPIPKGATITDAWVRFEVDETKGGTEPVNLIIEGELSPNPAAFSSTAGDISSRPTTTAQVQWSVPNWINVGDQGPDQTTPSIASIIQEIVNQNGWAGGAIVLIFRDNPANPSSGVRCAEAGPGSDAPLLHIDYQ